MIDKLNLGQFKISDINITNSRQKICFYEYDDDNWIEIIDTKKSMDEHYVVQFYKICELVDTEIMRIKYDKSNKEDVEKSIKKLIQEIY